MVFATLGERLSAENMYQMAGKLGLSQTVGWQDESFLDGEELHQIDQEEAGRILYNSSSINGSVLAQTAIGQRDVLVTPLQAANLIVTLLNHGVVYAPRLVSGIYYKDGSTLAQFSVQKHVSKEGGIQPHNAKLLLSWMEKVVSNGTGRILRSADWPLAGKSGTAQVIKNGKELNNQWFIGYGPVGNPKYAVAVLAQNRPLHSNHQAMQIFRSTMNILSSTAGS
ncbi:Penicillin-binding protein 4B [compost metagenome]